MRPGGRTSEDPGRFFWARAGPALQPDPVGIPGRRPRICPGFCPLPKLVEGTCSPVPLLLVTSRSSPRLTTSGPLPITRSHDALLNDSDRHLHDSTICMEQRPDASSTYDGYLSSSLGQWGGGNARDDPPPPPSPAGLHRVEDFWPGCTHALLDRARPPVVGGVLFMTLAVLIFPIISSQLPYNDAFATSSSLSRSRPGRHCWIEFIPRPPPVLDGCPRRDRRGNLSAPHNPLSPGPGTGGRGWSPAG